MSIDKGYLLISGTNEKNTIQLENGNKGLVVTIDGQKQKIFDINRRKNLPEARNVKHFLIDSMGGNDLVDIAQDVRAPGTILGGAGNDRLTGGSGNSNFFGGPGNDRIRWSKSAAAQNSTFTVYSSGGRDVVNQGAGTFDPIFDAVEDKATLTVTARGTFRGPGGSGNWTTTLTLGFDPDGTIRGTHRGGGSGSGKVDGCSGSFSFTINGTASGSKQAGISIGGAINGSGKGKCGSQSESFSFGGALTGNVSLATGTVTGSWNVTSDLGLISGQYNGNANVKNAVSKVIGQSSIGLEPPENIKLGPIKKTAKSLLNLMDQNKLLDQFRYARVRSQLEHLALGLPVFSKTGRIVWVDTRILKLVQKAAQANQSVSVSDLAGGRHSPRSIHYAGRAVDFSNINGKQIDFGKEQSRDQSLKFLDDLRKSGAFSPSGVNVVRFGTDRAKIRKFAEQFAKRIEGTIDPSKPLVYFTNSDGSRTRIKFLKDSNDTHIHIALPK